MRLRRLWIREFKNLRDFEITFDEDSPYTVLVGQNGSGKSNVFEALLQIFDSLERRRYPPFSYGISYVSRSRLVEIDGDPSKKRFKTVVHITPLDGSDRRRRRRVDHLYRDPAMPGRRFLPEFVFGYYSGFCGRFESPFREYRERYGQQVRQAETGTPIPRRLLYGDLSFAELILLALWAHKPAGDATVGLLGTLGIDRVSGVRLQTQPSSRFDPDQDDPRSLGLKGLLREFIAEMDLAALEGQTRSSGEGRGLRKDSAIDDEGLRRLASFAREHQTNVFSLLLQLREEGVIGGVSCSLELRNGDSVSCEALSEGEKQLLLALGMLRFAEHEEALFLLDEPDTHLNPLWSLQYLRLAEEEMGHRPSGHIVMATHDPLMFSGLTRREVRILTRDGCASGVQVAVPDHDPKGTGIPAILMSDIFGLRSVLDLKTQELLDEKRQLAIQDNRSEPKTARLKELNLLLRDVDVSQIVSDPLYPYFVRWVVGHRDYDRLRTVFHDGGQRGLRDAIAEDVAASLSRSLGEHQPQS